MLEEGLRVELFNVWLFGLGECGGRQILPINH